MRKTSFSDWLEEQKKSPKFAKGLAVALNDVQRKDKILNIFIREVVEAAVRFAIEDLSQDLGEHIYDEWEDGLVASALKHVGLDEKVG